MFESRRSRLFVILFVLGGLLAATSSSTPSEDSADPLAWQSPFVVLVDDIRRKFPDDFAGARVENDSTIWVAFSGDAPTDAATALGEFERPINIIENRGFTESELIEHLHETHHSAKGHALVDKIVSSYDIATGDISVTVAHDGSLSTQTEKDALVTALRAGLPSSVADHVGGIDFRVIDDLEGGPEASLGGGTKVNLCTAGFVIRNGSQRNLTTAGHCTDDPTYDDTDVSGNDVTVDLETEDSHEGEWGDLERLSLPDESEHSFVNKFRYNTGADQFQFVYTIAGIPEEGIWLTKFGQTTGYGSARVYRTNVSVNDIDRLVAMHNQVTDGGDSGGPWFDGTEAYGIHFGSYAGIGFPWVKKRSLFTPAHQIDDAFPGWTVATS